MDEFLLAAAGLILAMVALGLVRILRGPTDADRVMAAQLLGTATAAVVDVALTLALVAAFAAAAFAASVPGGEAEASARSDAR